MFNDTILYYNKNALDYILRTKDINLLFLYQKFVNDIKRRTYVLDVGSGSGRDTIIFINYGFKVVSLLPSSRLAELSNINPLVETILNTSFKNKFNGVWCCASLLHILKWKIKMNVKNILYNSLKPNGILYVSFKYGDFEGLRNGRLFSDWNLDHIKQIWLCDLKFLLILNLISYDSEGTKWLNSFLRKK